jgi:hypothetical protein
MGREFMLKGFGPRESPMPFRFPFRPAVFAVALGLTLAACSGRPFEIAPPEAVQSSLQTEVPSGDGEEAASVAGPRVISLCYGAGLNSDEEVLEEARFLCEGGTVEPQGDEDFFWNGCALFQPFRTSFICTPAPE